MTAAPGRTGRAPCVAIETQGCKLNLADAEQLAQAFAAAGFAVAPAGQPTGVYILNTCTVTHVAYGVKQQRLQAALDVAAGLQAAHLTRFVGDCRPVVWGAVEREGGGAPRWPGFTDNYLRVTTVSERLRGGEIAMARLLAVEGATPTGELMS